jgi:hypothetical protein
LIRCCFQYSLVQIQVFPFCWVALNNCANCLLCSSKSKHYKPFSCH